MFLMLSKTKIVKERSVHVLNKLEGRCPGKNCRAHVTLTLTYLNETFKWHSLRGTIVSNYFLNLSINREVMVWTNLDGWMDGWMDELKYAHTCSEAMF